MVPDSRMNYKEVYGLLFKDSECIDQLPFERKNLMRKARKILTIIMSMAYYTNELNSNEQNFKVIMKHGELDINAYLHRFTRNLFACLESCAKFRKDILDVNTDIPNKIYHGTSTKFLSAIRKEGLLPSKAGQCWKKDKEKKQQKVCLTDSMYAAEFYALNAVQEIGEEPVVLEFNIGDIKEKMKIRTEIFENGPSFPFDIYKEIYFNEPVPPNRIRNWYFVPKGSAFILLKNLADPPVHKEAKP